MAEYQPPEGPFLLQGPSSATPANLLRNSAASARRMMGGIAKTSGIAQFGDLALSVTGTDKNVTVASGGVWMRGTAATDQGVYYGYNAPAKNIDMLTANPAHATLNRIDLIVAVVEDTFYGGATDNWYLRQIVGVPNASPVAPAAPANSFVLAQVLIRAATVTIIATDVTDLRTVAYFGAGGPWKFYRNVLTALSAGVAITLPPAIPGLDDLRIDWLLRGDTNALSTTVIGRFNNDGTAIYDDEIISEGGAVMTPTEPLGNTQGFLGYAPALTAGASKFGQGTCLIKNYAGTLHHKMMQAWWHYFTGITGNTGGTGIAGVTYRSAAAITRFDVLPFAGNWIVGSLISASFE